MTIDETMEFCEIVEDLRGEELDVNRVLELIENLKQSQLELVS